MQYMTRILFAILLIVTCGLPVVAQAPRPLSSALGAMRDGNWDMALRLAARDGPVARDIIEWHRLRAGQGSYGDIVKFLDRRPDWPGLPWLHRKSEPVIVAQTVTRILQHFDGAAPQTARGVLAYAGALTKAGRDGEAKADLVVAWRSLAMPSEVQATYLERHADLLKPHHAARLDQMVWLREMADARRMIPLVPDGQAALARARIALHDQAAGVDALIEAVPDALRTAPGLAYDRFVWRARKGRSDAARELLVETSTSADALGLPAEWANRRRSIARQEMRDGNPRRAYRIASQHFLTQGSAYADLEWLSGYIALRKLNDPTAAVRHFQRFEAAIVSPISKGRAGYWLGRAYEAAGDTAAAQSAYRTGAQNQSSFYGLLAAERGDVPFDQALAGTAQIPPWRQAAFTESGVFQAGILLLAADQPVLAERFLTHLTESQNQLGAAQLGAMAIELGHPHLAVMIGKRAAQSGIVIPAPYYALHPVHEMKLPMTPEMTLAIARRESEFDPGVVSGAGARGLMQVMPATAREVAQDLGVVQDHSAARLLSDWDYNAQLGATYLAELAGRFDGNVVMMAAGYNAGPSRPAQWIDLYGDPREGDMDIVDWIEHIPFRETRNYVMRVTESLPIYRARLGKTALPVPFTDELTGSTLRAFAPKSE
jgi:soluble lytic murein transglycosylase